MLQKVGLVKFLKRVWSEASDDNCFGWASALAYSWLFAIFPFAIFLISLTPYLPERAKEGLTTQIDSAISIALPKDAAKTVSSVVISHLNDVLSRPRTGLLSIGLLVTLWAASGGMAMTMQALNRAFDAPGAESYIKQRSIAIALTAVVAFLILCVIILLPVGTIVINFMQQYGKKFFNIEVPLVAVIILQVIRYVLAIALMVVSLALTYHYGTNIKRPFRWITPGAIFCMLVWVVLGFAFRTYVNNFTSYSKTYGAVGGVVILLLFFYVDSLVLLIGAEINSELDALIRPAPATDDNSAPAAKPMQ